MALLTRSLVLASGSPYRARILREHGVEFTVQVSDVDEDLHPKDRPEPFVRSLAARKAMAVAARVPKGALVLAADTMCVMAGELVGKPADHADARRIIARACAIGLQSVISGVCVVDTEDMTTVSFAETSLVEMKPASLDEIDAYVATGEPMGKCGALCIESGAGFVKSWRGSFANVMGLPIERLLPLLLKLDVRAQYR
ncbi:MAG: septum formation protein Maf [Planctomycetes bacterium]|nr:septum formation protein Maf [Planctomycetota bacterium]